MKRKNKRPNPLFKKGKRTVPSHRKAKYNREENLILSALKNIDGAVASRALMRTSGVESKHAFYDAIHNLERKGEIKSDKKHRIQRIAKEADVEATIVSLSSGFAFARSDSSSSVREDIFIHGSDMKAAFLGDKVLLTDIRQDTKGLRGRVRKIKQRSKSAVTGTVRIREDGIFLHPDGAIRYDLSIRRINLKNAKDGDKVTVRPLQNSFGDWTEASVLTVFGSGESAKVCADAIIERFSIPTVFSEAAQYEADILSKTQIHPHDIEQRLDLRKKTVFTIDGADAKDLDDAISVEKTRDGGYRLGVHIADVSHYVKEGSILNEEAFARSTSVYFADRVIPMLPEALSNGACSLNAGEDKLTFSALIRFDAEGNMTRYDFNKTIIRSKLRGVYSEVNALFDDSADRALSAKYKPVKTALGHARALAKLLKEHTVKRGNMDLESTELQFTLDESGVCTKLTPRTGGEAEALIEQLMIAANVAAAKYAQINRLPFLYRVHEKPQPDRVLSLIELLHTLGISCKEIRGASPSPKDFGAVLERVKGTGRELLVSERVLRTMEKARYSENALGHFGLALSDYSHFTSPIRRYPDLAIHRILSAFLSGLPEERLIAQFTDFVASTAVEASKNEVRAVSAERAAEDCYVAEYMKQHIGETFTGIISGVTAKGLFIRIPNGAEGFVNLAAADRSRYEFDGLVTLRDRSSKRKYMVGDAFDIKVASCSVSAGTVDFIPADA